MSFIDLASANGVDQLPDARAAKIFVDKNRTS